MCDSNCMTNLKQQQTESALNQQELDQLVMEKKETDIDKQPLAANSIQNDVTNANDSAIAVADIANKLNKYMVIRDKTVPICVSTLKSIGNEQPQYTELNKKLESSFLTGSTTHTEVGRQFSHLFLERLKEIDRDTGGDLNMKLVTYKEWVDMLLHLNDSVVRNLEDLESEVNERLTLMQRRSNAISNCRHSQGNELSKCRKDIAALTRIIQNAYNNNHWDVQNQHFETLTTAEVFGTNAAVLKTQKETPPPSDMDFTQQHNKLLLNVKALAFEVAEKHDEVRDLQKQILSLEDEIQKAYLKIQLKDDVIKELRCELKISNHKLAELSTQDKMVSTDFESATDSNTESSSIPQTLKNNEIVCQYFQVSPAMPSSQNDRTLDICQRAEHEKRDAYRKLDFLRNQLVEIESISDVDSGLCDLNDTDGRIIDSIRRRIFNLKECSHELNSQVQQLSIENSELSANLAQEKALFERVSSTLRELADLLTSMTGQDVTYNRLFDSHHAKNPFLEPILAIKTMAHVREDELLEKLSERNNTIKSLQEELVSLRKNSKNEVTKIQSRNEDLCEAITALEQKLEEKQFAMEKSEKIMRKMATKKCKCLCSCTDQQHCQSGKFELELRNAKKTIDELRTELAQRNDMLAESTNKDHELEAYEVECNRLHKINQALTHEICRSSACRSALHRAKHCMFAIHSELSRLRQQEAKTIETIKKDCASEIKHYRDRYEDLSKELIEEREQKSQLSAVVRRLNNDNNEANRKNSDLLKEIQKISNLFEVQRNTYDILLAKHEVLSNNFNEQSVHLHNCHKQITKLQEKFMELEKINKADEVETRLLRDEVIYFKKEIACLQNKLSGAEEREHKFIDQIEHLHIVINTLEKKLHLAEASHKQMVNDLQKTKTEVSSRFDKLSQQYQNLDDSYKYL